MRKVREQNKYLTGVLAILIFAAAIACLFYGFRWLKGRNGRILPQNQPLGYDLSIYVGVDKDFVDSALKREGIRYSNVTTMEESLEGQTVYEIRQTIQGLPFVSRLVFAADPVTEEEGASSSNSLIPNVDLSKGKGKERIRCRYYTTEWVSDSGEWKSGEAEAAETIYKELVKKYGTVDKDNGYTILKWNGAKYVPGEMPADAKAAYEAGRIAEGGAQALRVGWIKTIAKNSFGDDCVSYLWSRTQEDGHLYILIREWIPEEFPYTKK